MAYTRPTFLDLPIEIRAQIFDLVFKAKSTGIMFQLVSLRPEDRYTVGFNICDLYMFRTQFPFHPLFLVSRPVSEEARAQFRCSLDVYRETDRGCRGWIERKHLAAPGEIGEAVVSDDFRGCMSKWSLESIRKITLRSVHGLDGRVINHSQFPRLEQVLVIGFGAHRELVSIPDETGETRIIREKHVVNDVVCVTTQRFRPVAEYREGQHDAMIARLVKRVYCDSIVHVESRQERGFRIRIEIMLEICYIIAQTLRRKGRIGMIIDYDEDRVIYRSDPYVVKDERDTSSESVDWPTWLNDISADFFTW